MRRVSFLDLSNMLLYLVRLLSRKVNLQVMLQQRTLLYIVQRRATLSLQ